MGGDNDGSRSNALRIKYKKIFYSFYAKVTAPQKWGTRNLKSTIDHNRLITPHIWYNHRLQGDGLADWYYLYARRSPTTPAILPKSIQRTSCLVPPTMLQRVPPFAPPNTQHGSVPVSSLLTRGNGSEIFKIHRLHIVLTLPNKNGYILGYFGVQYWYGSMGSVVEWWAPFLLVLFRNSSIAKRTKRE